jgi:NAD(P)-dependent dehydrogenase (short-subunit alcohol dehydrogenase family)
LEQTFALNHLAPFLLTNLLRDRLAGGRGAGRRRSKGASRFVSGAGRIVLAIPWPGGLSVTPKP